jgi:ribonucleoside-triphosphate reductase
MKRKFYYGVNFPASYCEKCGKSFTEPVNYCPHCGAPEKFITTYDRVCGYLGQTRVAGDTRLNKAKLCEIKDRKSM